MFFKEAHDHPHRYYDKEYFLPQPVPDTQSLRTGIVATDGSRPNGIRRLGRPTHQRMRRRMVLGLGIVGFSLCAYASYQAVNRQDAERPPGSGEHYYHWAQANGMEPHDLSVEVWNGAVSSDVDICSQIGVDTLKTGGNAVDGAIATAVCLGTVNAFASGIGGGGFMVYRAANGESKSFNFREAAPKAASKEMYHGEPLLAQVGGLAFGVPGEVDGFRKAHELYGKLPWKDLWQPSIDLSEKGFVIQPELGRQIKKQEAFFLQNLHDWSFLESTVEPGRIVREGEVLKRPAFAETLRKIAGDNGLEEFYRGSIAESLSTYAQKNGGIVTQEDFAEYKTLITDTLSSSFLGKEVITCPPPCRQAPSHVSVGNWLTCPQRRRPHRGSQHRRNLTSQKCF
jgi:hypothetical protein